MHEDLTELSNNMERGRKHWKQVGLTVEKKLHEAELLVDKVLPLKFAILMPLLIPTGQDQV